MPEVVSADRGPDPALVEAALAAFVVLPPVQRSALVLKDVLGHSLEETAATMGATIPAVKAALVRARANIAATAPAAPSVTAAELEKLRRYADLFNAHDWDGGLADGLPVIACFRPGATRPAYFVRLDWEAGRVVCIRDFRYVPYIADGASYRRA